MAFVILVFGMIFALVNSQTDECDGIPEAHPAACLGHGTCRAGGDTSAGSQDGCTCTPPWVNSFADPLCDWAYPDGSHHQCGRSCFGPIPVVGTTLLTGPGFWHMATITGLPSSYPVAVDHFKFQVNELQATTADMYCVMYAEGSIGSGPHQPFTSSVGLAGENWMHFPIPDLSSVGEDQWVDGAPQVGIIDRPFQVHDGATYHIYCYVPQGDSVLLNSGAAGPGGIMMDPDPADMTIEPFAALVDPLTWFDVLAMCDTMQMDGPPTIIAGYRHFMCEGNLTNDYPGANPAVCYGHGDCAPDDTCTCHPNWADNGGICNDFKCEDSEWYLGGTPCSGHGFCLFDDPACQCFGGYSDNAGECDDFKCEDSEWYTDGTGPACAGNGDCTGMDPACVCQDNWANEGAYCDDFKCEDGVWMSAGSPCSGNGGCVFDDAQCSCLLNWANNAGYCDDFKCEDGVWFGGGLACSEHGSCDETDDTCLCDDSYLSNLGFCDDFKCEDNLFYTAGAGPACSGHGTCTEPDPACVCDIGTNWVDHNAQCDDFKCNDGSWMISDPPGSSCGGVGLGCTPTDDVCQCIDNWVNRVGSCDDYKCEDGSWGIFEATTACSGNGACSPTSDECVCTDNYDDNLDLCDDYKCADGLWASDDNSCSGNGECSFDAAECICETGTAWTDIDCGTCDEHYDATSGCTACGADWKGVGCLTAKGFFDGAGVYATAGAAVGVIVIVVSILVILVIVICCVLRAKRRNAGRGDVPTAELDEVIAVDSVPEKQEVDEKKSSSSSSDESDDKSSSSSDD